MVNKIEISRVASYPSGFEMQPNKINFIYGSNGTGKTTLSQALKRQGSDEGNINVEFNTAQEKEMLVYNRHFIEKNFSQEISGIFTLGEDNIEKQNRIAELEQSLEEISSKLNLKTKTLRKLENELGDEVDEFNDVLWEEKIYLDDMGFSEIRQGYGVKAKFAEEMVETYYFHMGFPKRISELEEQKETTGTEFSEDLQRELSDKIKWVEEQARNRAEIESKNVEELKGIYADAFSEQSTNYSTIDGIDDALFENTIKTENESIFSERIVGAMDSEYRPLIEKLSNEDWVNQGRSYLNSETDQCPFCQQSLSNDIILKLNALFDSAYDEKVIEIQSHSESYADYMQKIFLLIDEALEVDIVGINHSRLKELRALLESKFTLNKGIINEKLATLSKELSLKSTGELLDEIFSLLKNINERIIQHNRNISNAQELKTRCKEKIWLHIVEKKQEYIERKIKVQKGKKAGINNIKNEMKSSLLPQKNEIEDELKKLSANLSGVQSTATSINNLLESFHFGNFQLIENPDNESTYLLRRPGFKSENAIKTLSEGEYNFITFLYFYHLVYGSHDREGLQRPKVVVIDDPVSSLDSNILFIVTYLVRNNFS